MILTFIFWLSLASILYVYIGYPLLIGWMARVRKRAAGKPPVPHSGDLPAVTLVIPACNEERWIERKIENTLALNYPRDRIQIIVASDGSTDRTAKIAQQFASRGVEVIAFRTRQGKQEMLNQIAPAARGEIVAASDANALLEPNSLRLLVRHFADPNVGGATGQRLCIVQQRSAASVGEGLYWRYETWIKESESHVHSCTGVHGQLYAIRKSIFPHVERVGEDFYIPMKVIAATGQRIIFDPQAIAAIPAAARLADEFERKTRAHVAFLLALPMLPELLIPGRSPIWWQYISHNLLRMAVPPALLALFTSSAILARDNPAYQWMAGAQLAFYAFAAVGGALARYGKRPKIFYVPFYFVFANAALGLAWIRLPKRKYEYAWQRTERLTDTQ
jgi:cellulose synthase/poly-beta-1,6-N-acetylglucosamine synthase-like glycosyltransferase